MNIHRFAAVVVTLTAGACAAPQDSQEEVAATGEELAVGDKNALQSWDKGPLVVTSTNGTPNALLVYNRAGTLLQTVPTSGAGGVGGNAGGVTAVGSTVAVVNFGSKSVSLFARIGGRLQLIQTVPTVSPPVSVALDSDHIYVLGTTTVESHRRWGLVTAPSADGTGALVKADGSSAQVGILNGQLIITEKSGIVELIGLNQGAVTGTASAVAITPKDSNTPLGLVTNAGSGYVTLAHSDEIGLIRDGALTDIVATGSGFPTGPGQQAPCWITRSGQFLYTANTPSHSISRLVATSTSISLDQPVAASTTGAPSDIAAEDGLLAVLEGGSDGSHHLTQFKIADDGSLAMTVSTAIAGSANGAAIVGDH
jgi:hypothetical protein